MFIVRRKKMSGFGCLGSPIVSDITRFRAGSMMCIARKPKKESVIRSTAIRLK